MCKNISLFSSSSVCMGTLISIHVCNSVSLVILRILYTSTKPQTHTLTQALHMMDDKKETANVGNFFETITYGGHVYRHTMHMLLYIHLCRYGSQRFWRKLTYLSQHMGQYAFTMYVHVYTHIYTQTKHAKYSLDRLVSEPSRHHSLLTDDHIDTWPKTCKHI